MADKHITLKTSDKVIGGERVFVIAEVGSTHNGSFDAAKKAIETVAATGADCVKFQTHIAEAETLRDAPSPSYFNAEPRFEYFKRTGFEKEQWRELKQHAEANGLVFLSSSFSIAATELLEDIGVTLHKVPSGEVTNTPYLEHLARTGTPTIMSSGMSSWEELDEAVSIFKAVGAPLAVLQCTSEYPVRPEHVGLNLISEMLARYEVPVGFSDHSMTNYAAWASVALGGRIIEKHITPSRDAYGSDAKHSLLPQEFAELVRGVREMEAVMASPVDKRNASAFNEMKVIFQKSVVATHPLAAGTVLAEADLTTKKPGDGIPPRELKRLLGKTLTRDVMADHKLSWDDVGGKL